MVEGIRLIHPSIHGKHSQLGLSGGLLKSGDGKFKLNQLILKLRWPIIAVIGILILVGELLEHPGALNRLETIFLSEVIILEVLLVSVGLAFGWFAKSIREKTSTLIILEAKNELSQQLTTAKDRN